MIMAMVALMVKLLMCCFRWALRVPTSAPSMPFMMSVPGAYWGPMSTSDMAEPMPPDRLPTIGPKIRATM